MSADQIILLAVGLIAIAAVAVAVAYATAYSARGVAGPTDPGPAPGPRARGDDPVPPPANSAWGWGRGGSSLVSPASTRQVARVVAFLYLAAVVIVVALTRAWPDSEPAIFTLLAAGTLLVVLFMDMLPSAVLGRWRRPVEGVGAIVFLGLLMALTGGVGSPFLLGFFLIVAGTALATEGPAPLLIAVLAALTVALVSLVVSPQAATQAPGLAWIGFSGVALILLADIATAAARAQRQARDEALRASRFDALTGLFNRAFFVTTMEQEIRRSDRMGRSFTMLMLDLDDLKPVNDTFGHQWGDRLLKAVADTIRETIRFTDTAARYGGDEFVLLLPETDAAGGYVVGEKLRRDIASLTLRAGDRNVRSSVSVGLVTYPDDGTTVEQLVAAADLAMYESKRRGKNRLVGYETRVERVATAIQAGGLGLVELGPVADVRTGGDPAPWGAPAQRPSAIPVEPDPHPAPLPDERVRQHARPLRPSDVERREPPRARPAPGAAPERPPERPRELPPPGSRPNDRPWLTRTDRPIPPPGLDAPAEGGEGGHPPRRPAADGQAGAGRDGGAPEEGRGASRRHEIRSSGERPWVVLPIEPRDPPERPKG